LIVLENNSLLLGKYHQIRRHTEPVDMESNWT